MLTKTEKALFAKIGEAVGPQLRAAKAAKQIDGGTAQDAYHYAALMAVNPIGMYSALSGSRGYDDTAANRLATLKKAVAMARGWGLKVPGIPRTAAARAEFAAWLVVVINDFAAQHGIDAYTGEGFCVDCGEYGEIIRRGESRRCCACRREVSRRVVVTEVAGVASSTVGSVDVFTLSKSGDTAARSAAESAETVARLNGEIP